MPFVNPSHTKIAVTVVAVVFVFVVVVVVIIVALSDRKETSNEDFIPTPTP